MTYHGVTYHGLTYHGVTYHGLNYHGSADDFLALPWCESDTHSVETKL